MRKVYFQALLLLCLPICGWTQPFANSASNPIALSVNSEVSPPKVFQPVITDNGERLLFQWERPAVGLDAEIEYEVVILDGEKVVLSFNTREQYFTYDGRKNSVLYRDRRYKLVIHSRVSDPTSSYRIDGDKTALEFRYEPLCTQPENPHIVDAGSSYLVISWDGKPAVKGETEYLIRYGQEQESATMSEVKVVTGSEVTLENLADDIAYDIYVSKLCYLSDGTFLESEPVLVKSPPVTSQLLGGCGAPFGLTGCPGTTAAPAVAVTYQTLKIRGFSLSNVLLTYQNYTYTGTAYLHLPFQSKRVKVNITAKTITTARVICDGEVEAISDLPAYWPNLFPPPAQTAEICLPSNTSVGFNADGIWMPDNLPWNPQGFGPDSTYLMQPPYQGYSPGAPFDSTGLHDPWGFDASCTNITTGTEFDPNGCSCYETDIYGQPCVHTVEPYYWLSNNSPLGAPTQAGLNFALQHQNAINANIAQALSARKLKIQILIDSIGNSCDSLRQIMTGLVGQLNYDSELIFGPEQAYLVEGMSKKFTSEPKILPTSAGRNLQTIQLEQEHVHLYHCDANQEVQKGYIGIINYFQSPAGMDSLIGVITDLVEHFSDAEAQKYSNPDSLAAWVKARVLEQINAKYEALYGDSSGSIQSPAANGDTRFGSIQNPIQKASKKATTQPVSFPEGAMLASGSPNPASDPAFWQSLTPRPQDLTWQYAQGFENIYGIDRGYFIENIAEERRKAALFPEYFTAHDSLLQPVEIPKWIGGRYYYVYLDKIKISHKLLDGGGGYTGYAKLDAYVIMDIPTLDQKVVLKADNVSFTPNGPEVVPMRLNLNNDVAIRMGNAVKLTLKKTGGSTQTYVEADCNGFVGLRVDGEVEICRNYVVPLAPTTYDVLPDPARVTGSFSVQLAHWNNFYTTITMQPFAVTHHEDYKWLINQVTIDFSDEQSPTGLPPEGYNTPFANAQTGFMKSWRGVYIANFQILLPKQFSKNGTFTSFGIERVVIDERGFSGTAKVTTPLITLDQGSASGWAFSVDKFQLTILANQIAYGGFGGKINVPIIKGGQCNPNSAITAEDCFNYDASILPDNAYQMVVTMPPGQAYCADLWKAGSIKINPNSNIKLEVKNGQFVATATLHGEIVVDAQIGDFELKMPDSITFQNLVIRSQAPYFSVGTWKMPNSINCQIAGFGLTVKDLGMVKAGAEDEYYLNFGLGISLTKEGNNADQDSLGISASANFKIFGNLTTPDGRQRWKFKEVVLSTVTINATFPGASIRGDLSFYNDPNPNGWGKGFRGILDAKFGGGKLMQTEIQALAQFGRKTGAGGFKYFFVDALVVLPTGIPLFPPLQMHGLGGGVFHHMTRSGTGNEGLPSGFTNNPPGLPSNLGVSLSGIQYVPDVTTGLGLKLTVVVSTPKETAFNGSLTLEMEFNSKSAGGGIKKCALDGTAIFMGEMNMSMAPTFTQSNPAKFKADAHITVQFTPNFKLHGDLKTYLHIANKISGAGDNGEMTNAEFHIEPGKWYINIGTPTKPCGVKFKIGGTNLATVLAYMDIGNNIPTMPPLPSAVQSMTGMGNFMANESARATGNGFAFGASITVGSGEKRCVPDCTSWLYFYAYLKATAGFDLMLQDYGEAECSNLGGADLGINGWYASGQAYALLQTGLGVGFRLFGSNHEIDIVSVGAAAALQMKLPNPFWAKGAVGGKFSVMGGLVKGNINFQFTMGESCQISGGENPSENLQVIAAIDPLNGSDAVDVSVHPTVSFNLPIGSEINISNMYGDAKYKTQLEYAKITHNGTVIPVEAKWQDDMTYLELIPKSMLPAYDSVKVEVKVKIFKNNQLQAPEVKTATLYTGGSYTNIPDFNVKAAYPVNGQYNFYPAEWAEQKGYILLYASQPDLFQTGAGNSVFARITAASGMKFEKPITYVAAQSKAEFALPAGNLAPQTMYKLEIIYKSDNTSTSSSDDNGARFAVDLPGIEGTSETVLYDAYFRTSAYQKFENKVAAITGQPFGASIPGDRGLFKVPISISEPFDLFEIKGYESFDLVSITARLTETPWFNNQIKPLIYDTYGGAAPGQHGIWVNERSPEPYGRIPYKGVFLEENSGSNPLKIDAAAFESGVVPTSGNTQYFNYFVPYITNVDWNDICYDVYDYVLQLCNNDPNCICCAAPYCCKYINPTNCTETCHNETSSDAFREYYIGTVLNTDKLKNMFRKIGYPNPPNSLYPIQMDYTLPGLGIKTTSRSLNLQKN